mmetsp:Transcript_27142/g.79037  ORF Transcript_27142/g.79037 Transcript_27142/m.79037 type:complete len:166 (+) Transcript_27142:1926-2423(+)
MQQGSVPPLFRMFVLSSLMAVDLLQYFLYRSDGTSYAVHLGGWLIGFAGGILVLRELEVDWCDMYITRPLAVLSCLLIIGFSLYWDPRTWPPDQPAFVKDINFGDDEQQCCWQVINCKQDYFEPNDIRWTEEEWSQLYCSGFDLGDFDDDGTLSQCADLYVAISS